MTKKAFQFEEAYERLEQILQQMNSGSLSLDKSITLYEEADSLIKQCSQYLETAEQKVQIIMKNRETLASSDDSSSPELQDFTPANEHLVSRTVES